MSGMMVKSIFFQVKHTAWLPNQFGQVSGNPICAQQMKKLLPAAAGGPECKWAPPTQCSKIWKKCHLYVFKKKLSEITFHKKYNTGWKPYTFCLKG